MSSAAGVRLVASAIGAGLAEAATLPADVAKVRLQIQSSALGDERYHGIVDCLVKVAKVEGVSALWKGIVPALIRQVSYHSFTFVLYEPIRDMVGSTLGYAAGEVNYVQKVLCAGVSAAIAISIFNPTEVIKTQMQSAAASVSMAEVIRKVYSKSGIQGFWAGLRPNVARTFLVNGAEIGTYDEAKLLFVALVGDGLAAHLGASFVAGLTSACVSTPADVVKTRFMNAAGSDQAFKGPLHTATSIVKSEGPRALYKGFILIVSRKLLWCMVFFVVYERLLATFMQLLRDLESV
eukprot:TRINITY_DN16204_c0_g1_i1.p1 TRINITY_DN16204_c0_g1~~TRINITY_DN16204_c0_g1_i1.p1  ORF type:complete len:293 (-),score=61.55 TRINITY_DN16204_c0_g1_i1:141-1019(-)